MTTKTNFIIALPILAIFGAGCAATTSDVSDSEVDPEVKSAASGLSIAEQRTDLVRGSLARNGIEIGFEFSVATGDVHHSKVWDNTGTLIESTLSNGYEDTTYLGGKAHVHGSLLDAEPTIEGDAKIFDTLNAHPTATLFFELRDALIAAKVPRELFATRRPHAAPAAGSDVGALYLNRGSFILPSGQSVTVATTWQSWVYTEFTLWAAGWAATSGCVQALTGWSAPVCNAVYLNQSPWRTGARYYGYSVKVSNNTRSLNGMNVDLGVNITEW